MIQEMEGWEIKKYSNPIILIETLTFVKLFYCGWKINGIMLTTRGQQINHVCTIEYKCQTHDC